MLPSGRRKLNRSLNRRAVRFGTRMVGGARRNRARWLNQALRAFARSIRAHKQLIKLAPRIYDPVVIRREAAQREKDEKWRQQCEAALRKAYGDEAVDQNPWPDPQAGSVLPRSPVALAAILRAQEDRKHWLEIGSTALQNHEERHPRYLPGFVAIVRLIELGTTLGRLACGMPLDTSSPEPEPAPWPMPDPMEAIRRIYGAPQPEVPPP